MAPPSWIILSTTPRVSDTPLPHDFALSLKVEAPPRVSFLTVAPCVSFLTVDFHFTAGSEGEDNTLVRYWSRTRSWRTELEASPDEHEDEVPDRYWVFDDVISHGGNIWWIDTKAGLLTCNAFRDIPPFLYVPLPDGDGDDDDDEEDRLPSDFKTKFEAGMVGRRYVQLSDGKFRCVQIRKPKGHAHGAGAAPTFITMRTLNDPKTGDWTDPEYTLSFADIRASDTFKAAGLPDKDPRRPLLLPRRLPLRLRHARQEADRVRGPRAREQPIFRLRSRLGAAARLRRSNRTRTRRPQLFVTRRFDQQEELKLGTVVRFLAGLGSNMMLESVDQAASTG